MKDLSVPEGQQRADRSPGASMSITATVSLPAFICLVVVIYLVVRML